MKKPSLLCKGMLLCISLLLLSISAGFSLETNGMKVAWEWDTNLIALNWNIGSDRIAASQDYGKSNNVVILDIENGNILGTINLKLSKMNAYKSFLEYNPAMDLLAYTPDLTNISIFNLKSNTVSFTIHSTNAIGKLEILDQLNSLLVRSDGKLSCYNLDNGMLKWETSFNSNFLNTYFFAPLKSAIAPKTGPRTAAISSEIEVV